MHRKSIPVCFRFKHVSYCSIRVYEMSDALVTVHDETDLCFGPVLERSFGVLVGCDIEVSNLGISITRRLSILKSDVCHCPAACATGSVLFASIKRKVHP